MHIDTDEQAEDRLAQLVKRAVAGEEIASDSNGESVTKQGNKKSRRGGQWKGKVKIAKDFDELSESFIAFFREENE